MKFNKITFSSPNAELYDIIIATTGLENKRYCADLILNTVYLNISRPFEIELIATDNGKPPRSSSTKVFISQSNEFPVAPDFDNAIYYGRLDNDFMLVEMDEIIINHYNENEVFLTKVGENANLFNINLESNKVEITLAKEINEVDILNLAFLKLELRISRINLQAVSSCGVIVSVPKIIKRSKFSKSLYDGNIQPPNIFNLERIIFETNELEPENVIFNLDRDDSKYFELKVDESNKDISLIFKEIDTNWRNRKYLEVQVTAKLNDNILDSTQAIIDVFEEGKSYIFAYKKYLNSFFLENNFQENIYDGLISVEGQLELREIIFKSNSADKPNFQLQGEDSIYFEMKIVDNVINIELKKENFEWKQKSFLICELNAIMDSNIKASTEIIIDVLEAGKITIFKIFKTGISSFQIISKHIIC